MSFDYLNEAFKKLSLLNEETFDTSLTGLNQLSDFMDKDASDDVVKVIDTEAEFEDEVQDSYIGKVITNCNVCHSHIFENKDEIVIDENGLVNAEKPCPYCGEQAGFTIVGEITPYVKETEEPESDPSVEVNGTPVESEPVQEPVEEVVKDTEEDKLKEGLIGGGAGDLESDAIQDKIDEAGVTVLDRPREKDLTKIQGTIADVLINHSAEIDACGANETAVKDCITRILSSDEVKTPEAAQEAIRIINKCRGPKLWSTIGTYMSGIKVASSSKYARRRLDASLEEDVNNVNVETDDSIVNIHSEDGGKVTVSTEPKIPETTGDEAIGPLSDETIADIESANGLTDDTTIEEPIEGEGAPAEGEEDVDIEEVDENALDELGESYLKEVYENVDSFKTSNVSSTDTHLVVEGVIKFKSGVRKKTGFIFEAHSVTPDGKVRFTGKNEHFSRGAKSFLLTGRIENKKLISESFTYNYRAKTTDGKSSRIYGTVRKK